MDCVDEPRFQWTRIQGPAEPADDGADDQHGGHLTDSEQHGLGSQHDGRGNQHGSAPDDIGQPTGGKLEQRGGQSVDGRDDADRRQVQIACSEQQHEDRELHTGLEPAHRQQDEEPPAQDGGVDHRSAKPTGSLLGMA